MISKAHTGKGFGGAVSYVTQKEGAELIDTQGIVSAETAAREMRALVNSEDRHEKLKPVYHASFSLEPGQKLTNEQWIESVNDFEKKLGLAGHQRIIVRHTDTEKDHVHVVWNRCHEDKRAAVAMTDDYAKREEVCRELENKFNLRSVPGPHSGQVVNQAQTHRQGDGARQAEHRRGVVPLRDVDHEAAAQDLRESRSWRDLSERLAARGEKLEAYRQGLVVTTGDRGAAVGLSKLTAGEISKAKLEQKFSEKFGTTSNVEKEKGYGVKPNVATVGRKPPPQARGRLRDLSAVPVACSDKGRELLLSSDVRHNMDNRDRRVERDIDVRRSHDRAGQRVRAPRDPAIAAERQAAREKLWSEYREQEKAKRGGRKDENAFRWNQEKNRRSVEKNALREKQQRRRDTIYRHTDRGLVRTTALLVHKWQSAREWKRQEAEALKRWEETKAQASRREWQPQDWKQFCEEKAAQGNSAAEAALRSIEYGKSRAAMEQQPWRQGDQAAGQKAAPQPSQTAGEVYDEWQARAAAYASALKQKATEAQLRELEAQRDAAAAKVKRHPEAWSTLQTAAPAEADKIFLQAERHHQAQRQDQDRGQRR